jgi:hypothetical protein
VWGPRGLLVSKGLRDRLDLRERRAPVWQGLLVSRDRLDRPVVRQGLRVRRVRLGPQVSRGHQVVRRDRRVQRDRQVSRA